MLTMLIMLIQEEVDRVTDATDGVHPPVGVHHVLPVKKLVHLLQLGKNAKH